MTCRGGEGVRVVSACAAAEARCGGRPRRSWTEVPSGKLGITRCGPTFTVLPKLRSLSLAVHTRTVAPGRLMVRDYAGGVVVYCRARMKLSLVRLVATLLLTGQMLPIGLPMLCDQVQRGTPANCEQKMASHLPGPVVDAMTHATPCANPAFCGITASAAPAVNAPISVCLKESSLVSLAVWTLAPADPQPPLPPPPQA